MSALAIGDLIVKLVSEDWGTRMKASIDIAGYGSQAEVAVPLLRKMSTDDPQEDVRQSANDAVTKIEAAL